MVNPSIFKLNDTVADSLPDVALEEATFDVLWDLSKPGSDAEESFLRIPQTHYYQEEVNVDIFEKMPNVSNSFRDFNLINMTLTPRSCLPFCVFFCF